MPHKRIDRSTASRIANGARLGACALVVCGMAVAVLGVPGAAPGDTDVVSKPAPSTEPEPLSVAPEPPIEVDARGIAMRLSSVGNAPKPPPDLLPDEEAEPVPGDTAVAMATDEVSFLGLIREPGRLLALVRIDGRQVVMWTGREISGVRLSEVAETHIVVERNGATRRIERAERKGAAFTRLEPIAPAMPAAPPVAEAQPNGAEEMSREELLRRVREQARGQQRMIRRPPGEGRERFGEPGERNWREDR